MNRLLAAARRTVTGGRTSCGWTSCTSIPPSPIRWARTSAILKAGKDGAAWGRQWERKEDDRILETLKKEGKVELVPFADRAKLLELAAPVKAAFAKEIEAEKILAAIDAVK